MRRNLTIAFVVILVIPLMGIIKPFDETVNFIISEISVLLAILSLYIPISYTYQFEETNWENIGEEMKLSIPRKKHRQGKVVTCELYEFHSQFGYKQCMADIFINEGNVSIIVGKGSSFKGKAIVRL